MFERYRTIGAMLTLREFTVDDVATRAEVSPATVRTVLHRMSDDIEVVGTEQSGRRGGQPRRYVLREGSVGRLMSELRNVEQKMVTVAGQLGAADPVSLGSGAGDVAHSLGGAIHSLDPGGDLPAEVELARGILFEELPDLPPGDDRRWRVVLAQTALQGISEVLLDQNQDEAVRQRNTWLLSCLDFVAELALSEESLYANSPSASLEALKSVAGSLKSLLDTQDPALEAWVHSLRERVVGSPASRVLVNAVPEVLGNGSISVQDPDANVVVLVDMAKGGSLAVNDHFQELLNTYDVNHRRLLYDPVGVKLTGSEDSDDLLPFLRSPAEYQGAQYFNPVWVVGVDPATEEASNAVAHLSQLTGGVGHLYVASEYFDPDLNNQVHLNAGQFLPTQGLTDQAVLGAFGITAPLTNDDPSRPGWH